MSELEPNDSRVVHGNAKPEKGDERFAQTPEQARQPGKPAHADESAGEGVDDERVSNPEAAPSLEDERGAQQEQSIDNGGQFQASDLDRGEAQYQDDPLVRQQHQQNDWSGEDGDNRDAADDFETGQADYGGAEERQHLVDDADEGDLEDDDIDDAAPQQARIDGVDRSAND